MKELLRIHIISACRLRDVTGRKYIMRLDQGPTASFKDFAARMMGRLMHYYLQIEDRKLLILTATSGDTGSAVANAFYGLGNVQIVILFPKDGSYRPSTKTNDHAGEKCSCRLPSMPNLMIARHW